MENTPSVTLSETFMQEVTRKHAPDAVIRNKSESWLNKAIAFVVKPFNPNFLDGYITTLGTTIWISDSFMPELDNLNGLEVITHETQHIIDYNANRFLFVLSYGFPQILALLSILALGAFWSPWMALWLLCLGFAAPFPSPGRYKAELAGYRTSVLFRRKVYKQTDEQIQDLYDQVEEQLSKKWYYFTWPFPAQIRADLQDESFMKEPRYQEITKFLVDHKLIDPEV